MKNHCKAKREVFAILVLSSSNGSMERLRTSRRSGINVFGGGKENDKSTCIDIIIVGSASCNGC
ncbi:MAG: hypothetical protein QXG00_04910 [Candidatus Woesearchaeota archaeon]